jgi:ketosteroid isomerase-like protein
MRYLSIVVFTLASSLFLFSQGPCTEAAIKKGDLPMADDGFSYVPSFAKPVTGRAAFAEAAEAKLAGRTNVEHSWESDRVIVASVSGDMAFERGIMDVGYDEEGKPHSSRVVVLFVYKAKGSVCERVAETMQPLEESKR